MPELPEVETVARILHAALAGRRIKGTRFLGRMRRDFDPGEADRLLAGKRILAVRRRAKYIYFECEAGTGLLAHLGMTGSFRIEAAKTAYRRHDRAALVLDRGEELRYADARRFGFIRPVVPPGPGLWPDELSGLGREPLERGFNAGFLAKAAERRKTPVKPFLMDQSLVVGIGNIYANEALHRAGIDPRREAGGLTREEWKRAAREVRAVLRESIRRGGSTIRDYRSADGSEGAFQLSLRVYGRKDSACPLCASRIVAVRQCGRSTFFCPCCQK